MTKIFSVLLLSFAFICKAQGEMKFEEIPFKELIAKAKKENKLVFIDAYASWCGPCKMMERNIFPKKTVGDVYNKSFVNARIDMEKGEGREIAQKYGVRSYPTYLFLNGDGELISQNFGYMEESAFIAMANDLNSPDNKKGSLKDRFAAGENDSEFLINIMRLNSSSDFDFAKKASERYFDNKKKTDEFTKDDVGLLLYFLKSPEDKNYRVFTERKADIIKFLPEETYKEFNDQIVLARILTESIDDKSKKINDAYYFHKAVPLVGKEAAETKLLQTKLAFYEQNGNFAEYEKAALAYYRDSEKFDKNELLKAAWVFSDNVKNHASLKKAAEWAEKSVMTGETAENTYILAKIYSLLGNKELAKNFAEMSRNIAKQSGKDASLAEELLQKFK
ncbi:disulfide isomerase [Chryseobacterium sp. Leaf180]|uniref:thioredoxin family protein n=1 Tax=Chryseobacterium sp. Leaf180 TaxID=1736289 RepID=UPI0006F51062|nr:thioredoxin family protein [Chryseobacterium sp. Leaf180]KQR92575.1 disulfide isomerase [Chryseobacterium sp. Leaf180]